MASLVKQHLRRLSRSPRFSIQHGNVEENATRLKPEWTDLTHSAVLRDDTRWVSAEIADQDARHAFTHRHGGNGFAPYGT